MLRQNHKSKGVIWSSKSESEFKSYYIDSSLAARIWPVRICRPASRPRRLLDERMLDELKNQSECNKRQCDVIRCPSARIDSSGASGRVIFKFRARLWTPPIVDVGKIWHNSKSVARIKLISFSFCFKNSWRKKFQISSLMMICHVRRGCPLNKSG